MGAIIAILNPKGGAGKSTIATNIARGFQMIGKEVLLADSDPQGTARAWASIEIDDNGKPPVMGVGIRTMEGELTAVKNSFDYIIIDGAAKLEATAMVPSIKVADLILIPVQPSGADIWACEDLVDIIKARREATNGKPLAYFIVSRAGVGEILTRDVYNILDEMGLPTLDTRTSDRTAFKKALTNGVTVFEMDTDGKARSEVEGIVQEIRVVLDGERQLQ